MANKIEKETIREFFDRNYDDDYEGVYLMDHIDTQILKRLVAIECEATPYMYEDEDGDLYVDFIDREYYEDDYEMKDVYSDIMIECKKKINELVNKAINEISDKIDAYGECIAHQYDGIYEIAKEFEEELEVEYHNDPMSSNSIIITSINKHF